MAWLFEILPFLIFIFVVSSVIRAAAKVGKKLNEGAPPRRAAEYDPAEAERTRRIQEEIRRKIAERRGGNVPPPLADLMRRIEDAIPAPVEEAPPPVPVNTTSAILERQQQLAEQMRALEASRLAEQRKAAELQAAMPSPTLDATDAVPMRDAVLADLRTPTVARRAILLREILGSPVGLR